MIRFGYKSLLVLFFMLAGTVPLAAYYYFPGNQPPDSPPNYNQIDPASFYGVPSISELPPADLDRYFVYYDSMESRWSILRAVPFATELFEQFQCQCLANWIRPDRRPPSKRPLGMGQMAGFDCTQSL
jgi:hypothetical protein